VKQKHLYSLLDATFTTINVVFQRDENKAAEASVKLRQRFNDDTLSADRRTFVYKAPLAMGVEAGDFCVINTQNGLSVVKVDSVDATPQIDTDADFDYKWIVQKINLTAYDARVKRESAFTDMLRDVERVRQRETLVNDMREHLPAGSEARAMFDRATMQLTGSTSASPLTEPAAPPVAQTPQAHPFPGQK